MQGLSRALGLAFVVWLAPAFCLAQTATQDAAKARELGYRGIDAYDEGDYQEAVRQLREAYSLLKVPSLGLWLARALVKQGALLQASSILREVTELHTEGKSAEVQEQARSDALTELVSLESRTPSITLHIKHATHPQLTLNGKATTASEWGAARALDPGAYHIEVIDAGRRVARDVVLQESEKRVVEIDMGALPDDSASVSGANKRAGLRETLGWAGVASGGALVLAGATVGLVAASRLSGIRDNPNCQGNSCAPSEVHDVDAYESARILSEVGFVSGGILCALGAALLVFPQTSESLGISFGPTAVKLSGRF